MFHYLQVILSAAWLLWPEPLSLVLPGSLNRPFKGRETRSQLGDAGMEEPARRSGAALNAPSLWERTGSPGAVWAPRVEHTAQQGDR